MGEVSSIARVWASTLLAGMYNDLGLTDQAREVLTAFTEVARSADELQTTVPHLGQLARTVESEEERAELVQEMLALVDETTYLRYDMLPALRLASTWLAQTPAGATAALDRLEKVHEQVQDRQSAACLLSVSGPVVRRPIRSSWNPPTTTARSTSWQFHRPRAPTPIRRSWPALTWALT